MQSVGNRVEILDPIRLLAALAVVIYHYSFRGAAADGFTTVSMPTLAGIGRYGYLGVHLFFMVSGFIIAHSAHGRNPRDFAIARGVRIYPGFVLCMSITAATALLLSDQQFHVGLYQWLANLFVWSPGFKQPYVDGVYWTLLVEIRFYAWVALFLAFGIFERHAMTIAVIWLTLSLINLLALDSWRVSQIFLTSYSGFFAVGLAIHELYRHRGRTLTLGVLAYAVAVSILQAIVEIPQINEVYGADLSPWIVASVVLASCSILLSVLWVRRVPISRAALLAIGGLTYPLYLLHQNIGYMIFNRLAEVAPGWVLVPAMTVAMVALSLVVWRWLEKPAQKALAALIRRQGQASATT